jgi:hypothetical protein
MMRIDLKGIIKQLKEIETKFNASQSPTERYALLQALNHLCDHQIRYADDHWVMEQYRKAMLSEQGIDPDIRSKS